MKKTQKIIGLSFFGLIAFTFFMLFVNSLTQMGNMIDSFHYFGQSWGFIISWFLETGLSVTILVLSIMTLIGMLQGKEKDAKALVKKNYFDLFLYFVISVFGGIFTLINTIQLAGGYDYTFTKVIVLIIFEIAGAVLALLASIKRGNEKTIKRLGSAAYAILFVTLVFTASNGIKGFLIACIIFMFLVNILGLFHALTYDINFKNLFKEQEAPVAVEEKKEEQVEEEKTEEEQVEEIKEDNNDADNAEC